MGSSPTGTIHWDAKVRLMDIIQLVILLSVIIAGWYKFDYRLGNLELSQTKQDTQFARMTASIELLNETLSKLNQQLVYFPPHAHVDHEIVYPDGHRENEQGEYLPNQHGRNGRPQSGR